MIATLFGLNCGISTLLCMCMIVDARGLLNAITLYRAPTAFSRYVLR